MIGRALTQAKASPDVGSETDSMSFVKKTSIEAPSTAELMFAVTWANSSPMS